MQWHEDNEAVGDRIVSQQHALFERQTKLEKRCLQSAVVSTVPNTAGYKIDGPRRIIQSTEVELAARQYTATVNLNAIYNAVGMAPNASFVHMRTQNDRVQMWRHLFKLMTLLDENNFISHSGNDKERVKNLLII